MVTRTTTRNALTVALMLGAAASMAACASKPKPAFPTTAPPASTAPPSNNTAPPPAQVGSATLPGSEQDFVVNVGDRVYFDFDSYSLRDDAQSAIAGQAAWLQRYPAVRIRIEGNCDERGTREYNLALGARRANAVRDYLVSHGVTADRLATVSYGKEKPMDTGEGDVADQHNRNAHTAIIGGAR
jgi:peptidoglycan-associated lipoprotein